MIKPAAYSLSVTSGATFRQEFQLKDSTRTPVDLSSSEIDACITTGGGDKVSFGVVWVDRSSGKFSLNLDASKTAVVGLSGNWTLFVVNPDTTRDCWLSGLFSVSKSGC